MADNPMVEFRRLAERFIERNVVNAGNTKARGNTVAQQRSHHSLCAGHLADLGRGMRGNGHAQRNVRKRNTADRPAVRA
jgi:hypothetical protein